MKRIVELTAVVVFLSLAPAIHAAASGKHLSYLHADPADLIHALPELSGVQPGPPPAALQDLLEASGQSLGAMLSRFEDVSADEDVHELHFEDAAMTESDRHETFRYVTERRAMPSPWPLEEFRTRDSSDTVTRPDPKSGFLVFGNFLDSLRYLFPGFQSRSHFRYLGQVMDGGQNKLVLAFAKDWTGKDSAETPSGNHFDLESQGRILSVQGFAWLDAGSYRIDRVYLDLLGEAGTAPIGGRTLDRLTVDAAFVSVKFPSNGRVFWLPAQVTVDARDAQQWFHTVHRYANFRLRVADYEADPAAKIKSLGVPASAPVGDEDAAELLARGIALGREGKWREALIPLAKSRGLDPALPETHYHLAIALAQSGDLAGAEASLRETLKLMPGSAEPSIRIDVRQVLVPVVVTDKEGHHVVGLKQPDFKVFEDGAEQTISAFSVEHEEAAAGEVKATAATERQASGPTPVQTATPARGPAPRTYLICIDVLHAAPGNLVHVREAVKKLFQEDLGRDARYVVVALGAAPTMIQETTTDPAAVVKAVEAKSFEKLFLESQMGSGAEIDQFRRTLQEVRSACDSGMPDCSRKKQLPFDAEGVGRRERIVTTGFLRQLRFLLEQLAKGRSPSTVLLISDGFQLVPGKAAFEMLAAYFPEVLGPSLSAIDRMTEEFEPVLKLASKSNIPIYTVDSRGLYTSTYLDASVGGAGGMRPLVQVSLSQVAAEAGETLTEMAEATGGTAFHNRNDLVVGMERAIADGREYYTLAYVSANSANDGRFRAITVKVKDSHLKVNAKRGYWADVRN